MSKVQNKEAMLARSYACFIAIALLFVGCGLKLRADDDVTIVAPPSTSASPASDATPVVHKSHKKKSHATATASAIKTSSAPAASSAISGTTAPAKLTSPIKTIWTYTTPGSDRVESEVPESGPAVETGLPVARYTGGDDSGAGPIPASTTFSRVRSDADANSSSDGYSSRGRTTGPSDDFVFTNFSRKEKNFYPWKTGIITTIFWIGEPGSDISSTDNMASSWDQNWVSSNGGKDTPDDRNGYDPAGHAPTLNTFYVALPFNDLADPDKAREWVPPSWHRPRKDGKEVSACKDRWVEIKNAEGRICFAQWEDVGPLVSDHAEYVFGPERPDTLTRAGLDVSPAVAKYLGIDSSGITSWKFVDDEDVQPGAWLRYDELALLFTAMHQQKNDSAASSLPIQRSSEPIDDPTNLDSNKKKVGAAKG